ncbi:MAG: glycosyltransferase [Betaproteobacteria bacterium]|nr:MAG: glycosyltransferase [Betaproteobacteria bacterium]
MPVQSPAENLPLVSVVIPSYNHARYLAAAIDSVLAQDYPRVELIVIDDGSTDGSPDVLKKYDQRFHWEVQANQGQAATMNRGWTMSRGEILAYLSADDILLPNAASAAVSCLRRNAEAVLCYCDFNLIDPGGRLIRRISTPDFSYRDMLVKVICPPGPGAFFRRHAFETTGFWDGSLRTMLDYDYWLRLGLQGSIVSIPQVLALYRMHAGQETFSTMNESMSGEPVRIVSRVLENPALPGELAALKSKALSNAHLHSAQLHFRGYRYRLGLQSLRQAFVLCPRNLFTWKAFRMSANVVLNRALHRALWKINRVLRG